jgi:hypothetical protein
LRHKSAHSVADEVLFSLVNTVKAFASSLDPSGVDFTKSLKMIYCVRAFFGGAVTTAPLDTFALVVATSLSDSSIVRVGNPQKSPDFQGQSWLF